MKNRSESVTFLPYRRRFLNYRMAFLKTMFGYLDVSDKSEIWNLEVQKLTEQLANRNTEHEKLETFKDNLRTTFDTLASKKDEIDYLDFLIVF